MILCVGYVRFDTSECKSLKEKRSIAKSLIGKARARYNASIAEVGNANLSKELMIGVSVVSNSESFCREALDKILNYMEEQAHRTVLDRLSEILPMQQEF